MMGLTCCYKTEGFLHLSRYMTAYRPHFWQQTVHAVPAVDV